MFDPKIDLAFDLLACDLDRTLIYSAAGLQLPMSDDEAPTLMTVEVLDGRPQSFLTLETARELYRLQTRGAMFVPVTTRTLAQYRRFRLTDVFPRHAVTSNGGHVLHDGVSDLGWHHQVRQRLSRNQIGLSEVQSELRRRASGDWVLKRRVGDELFCYLVVELTKLPEDFLPSFQSWCADRGWQVSIQGRKIYAIPAGLSKESAVAYVAEMVEPRRVLAAGDGALDAGLLTYAEAGVRPPHGELAAMNWQHPTVTVTKRPGVMAGEDIMKWFERKTAEYPTWRQPWTD